MNIKHRGALTELSICSYLLEQGYEVFRNISSHGFADIIAWKPGEAPIFLDGKTSANRCKNVLNEEQKAAGVKIANYSKETGKVTIISEPPKRGRPARPPK